MSGNARCTVALSDDDFTHNGVTYEIVEVRLVAGSHGGQLAIILNKNAPSSFSNHKLRVDGSDFAITTVVGVQITALNTGLNWSVGATVSLSLVQPAPTPTGLSIEATPACGTTVTDLSVEPRTVRVGTPGDTQYRVLADTNGAWRDALPIAASGRSSTSHHGSLDALWRAYPGFSGFQFRLTNDTSVTAVCTWDFGGGAIRPTVDMSAPDSVPEGSPVTVTLALPNALSHDVVIPLTIRTRVSDRGDVGTLSSIRIRAGETSGTGTIRTARDADTFDETFTVALDVANLPPSVQAGFLTSQDVTISEIQRVSLEVSPTKVTEGSPVTVTVSLTGPLPHDVDISLDLNPISSETAPPPDHGTLPSIRIRAGATRGTGTITTARDADTDDEQFWLGVATWNLPALGLTTGGTTEAVVTITDETARLRDLQLNPGN